jgi:hypothetical protein
MAFKAKQEDSRSERRAYCKWEWRMTDKTHGLNYAEFWQEYGALHD